MKQTWKQIGSLFLSVCMVVTMLPVTAFAETGTKDSGAITAFAALDEDIAVQTVVLGTAENKLNLPKKLTVIVTKTVTTTTGSAVTATVSGDDTATGSEAQKQEQQEETKEITEETTVDVTCWTSDQPYDGDVEGDYVFTPTLALPEDLTLSEGVRAPTVTVTVETEPAVLPPSAPQARGMAAPFGAGASSVGNATDLKTALESTTADTITVTASFTLTDAVEVKADHTLIIEDGFILTLGDFSSGSATLTVPTDKTLTVNGAGTLEVRNTTTSSGVVVHGSMVVSGGNLTVKNSGANTLGIWAIGSLRIENISVLSVANTGTNTGIQGDVTIKDSTATISNTNSSMTGCKGISASSLTIDNSTVTMSNSIYSVGIQNSGGAITLKDNAHVIAGGAGSGIHFSTNSGSLTVDGSILELQSGTGLNLSFPDEVAFTGLNSGTVRLSEGTKIGSANGKMEDQGFVLTKDYVTVGAADATPSADSLTAGDYVWDGTHFAKGGGTFFDTATATFNLANLPATDESGGSDATAWTWSNTNKLLKLTGTGTYTLTGTANGMGVEVTADGATVILDGVTLTGADVSDYGLENKLNKGACPLFSRSSAVPLSLVVKNGTTNVITAISISALYAAGNLTLTGTGSLTVTGGDGYSGGSGIDIEGNSCIVNGPAVTAVGGNERLPMSTEGGTLAIQSGSLTLKNIWNNYDEALDGNGKTLSVTVASAASFTTVKGDGNGHGYLAGTDNKTTITNNGGTVYIDGSVLGKAINNEGGSFTVTGAVAASEGNITKPSLPDVTVNLASASTSTENYEVVTGGTHFTDLQNMYGAFTTFLMAKKAANFTLTGSGADICWVDTNETSAYLFSSMTIGSYAINSASVQVNGNNASGGTYYAGNQSGATYTGTGTLAITKPSEVRANVGLSLNNGDDLVLDGPNLTVSSYETAINKLHLKSGSFTADGVADFFEISGGTAIFNDTGSATLKSWNVKHTGGQLKITTYGTLNSGVGLTAPTSSALFREDGGSLVADTYLWGEASYNVARPADPTKFGFVFGGWYADATLENEAVFGSVVTNTVYYAKWNIATGADHTITVINGTASPTSAAAGTTVTLTADAAPSGQQFKEWSISPTVTFTDGTDEYSESAKFPMPNEAVTATATYEQDTSSTLYILDTPVTDTNKDNITGPSISGSVSYDPATKTLTLNNATISPYSNLSTAYLETGISAMDDLTVKLIGQNRIGTAPNNPKNEADYNVSGGIASQKSLSITGEGSLTIYDSVTGLYGVDTLTVDIGGSLIVTEYGDLGKACCLKTDGVLTIKRGSLDLTSYASKGLYGNSIVIEGGIISTQTQGGEHFAFSTMPSFGGSYTPDVFAGESAASAVKVTSPTAATFTASKYVRIQPAGAETYTIALNANGGSVSPTTMQTDTDGKLTSLPAPIRSGSYRFDGWFTAASGGTKVTASTVFGTNTTIYAHWTDTSDSGGNGGGSGGSGGGSSSGGSSSSTTTPTTTTPGKTPNQPVTAAASVTATASQNGIANASIPEKSVTDAIAKAQADAKAQGKTANGIIVALNVTMPKGATSLTATLTRTSFNSLVSARVTSLELNGSPVNVSFDTKALAEIQKQSSGNISITIAPNAKLSAAAKGMIGTRPVYDLTVSYTKDGKNATVTTFGGGTATVSVPYTPAKGEAVGGLYAVYVDAKGNATRIAGSAYDANSGCVMFTTTHFSLYGIGYTAPSAKFTDIKTHWAKESIDYVVGRGLLSGTAETTFAPDTAMTRGMLVTALGRLANVDTKVYTTNSFTDVKADSAFRPYIEWAYKKGIVQGVGNSQFAPDRAISREEIAVIFANFAKATGYTLPVTRNATTYADASSIGSTYKTAVTAMQQAGIMIGGTSNKFNPKSSATRAEVSSMLHRYIKLTIDPDTAQGWTLNDAGQYLYYKNGKSLTGTQTIDSVKYFFNTDGTLKTGWVKDDAGNWRFYSGNTMLVGFWDLGANGNNKTYYFTKDGIMVAGKWLEIDGKWYYFNADGSLAKSTKVDGYEVDEDGVRKTKGN